MKSFLTNFGHGFLLFLHGFFQTLGLALTLYILLLILKPDWVENSESQIYRFLLDRQISLTWMPRNTASCTATNDLKQLTPQQAAVANWLAKKHHVSPDYLATLVAEAQALSTKAHISPYLILAVMSVESNFHPYVQSAAGAQGLMQVMTHVHASRFEQFGGKQAAFDPITNMRVGVSVLVDCIRQKDGSVEEGLKYYLGVSGEEEDGGYVEKVKAEQVRFEQIAAGASVAIP